MAPVSDPYRALGVPRGATAAQIKAAHRSLAKRYHPDASAGDARRFLLVQEAYRVLSDPLLRREWDARHAPGPVRADTPTPPAASASRPRPDGPKARARRRAAQPAKPTEPSGEPAHARPRSARSYTWSAAEVPWWEEGVKRDPKRTAKRRPAAHKDAQTDFEVYNRSSGAAWSMAARAYFRKGDQDLPSRGVFRHQGGQPITAGRARAAAEVEARQRAAHDGPPAASETDADVGDGVFGRLRRKLSGAG